MPFYHFNIRDGRGFTPDDEGLDLSSATEGKLKAVVEAVQKQMM